MKPRVTIRDVAVRAGVSPSTVSRVLNGRDASHMRRETRERVLAAIRELDYTPAKVARSLRKQRTQAIGILLPDVSNPFFSLLARGVESVAFEAGYSVIICDSNHDSQKEAVYLSMLLEERVEGLVFIPVGQPAPDLIQRLLNHGVKIVVADRRVDGLPTVSADNRGGSASLARYLLDVGYRKIAYLAGPKGASSAEERLAGLVSALKEEGLSPVWVRWGHFTFESGYHLTRKLLSEVETDAIVAGNDLMAVGAIRAVEERGLRVPEDIGVAGFDHIPLADLVKPRLTTVESPASRIGEEAARQLMEGTCRDLCLPVELIPGASCAQRRW